MTFRFMFKIINLFAKKYIIKKWGKAFYSVYIKTAKQKLLDIESQLPLKVDDMFDIDYKGIAAYVPIYYALMEQNICNGEIDAVIWQITERIYKTVPKSLMKRKNNYTKQLEKFKAYQKKGEKGLLGENDWVLQIEEGDGSYYCRVTECGAYKVLKNKGYGFVFPCVCRVDYLQSNLRGFKYERDKTIGDGDDFCNNHFMGLGITEWAPEKGFKDRR